MHVSSQSLFQGACHGPEAPPPPLSPTGLVGSPLRSPSFQPGSQLAFSVDMFAFQASTRGGFLNKRELGCCCPAWQQESLQPHGSLGLLWSGGGGTPRVRVKLKCFHLVLRRPALLLAPCWPREAATDPVSDSRSEHSRFPAESSEF